MTTRKASRRLAGMVVSANSQLAWYAQSLRIKGLREWASRVVILMTLLCGGDQALALITIQGGQEFRSASDPTGPWFPTVQAACDRVTAARYSTLMQAAAAGQVAPNAVVGGPIVVRTYSCGYNASYPNWANTYIDWEIWQYTDNPANRYNFAGNLTYNVSTRAASRCPINSTAVTGGCQCVPGAQENSTHTACIAAPPEPSRSAVASGAICKAPPRPIAGEASPNPIAPATGDKLRFETDLVDGGPSPLSFGRIYRSTWGLDASRLPVPMGVAWTHTHSAKLAIAAGSFTVFTAEGYARVFAQNGGTWIASNSADTLTQSGTGFLFHKADDDSNWLFDAYGKLLSRTERNGWATSYSYDPSGELMTITNGFGRTLTLAYNGLGQLISVTTGDGRVVGYSYDTSNRLSVVTYPGGATRSFLYENAAFPQALTGINDESGTRFATFAYDTQGRAVSSELAGSVDRYSVSYATASSSIVTDPLMTNRTYTYSTNKGKLAVIGSSMISGTGEDDANFRVQDANGLITSETTFRDGVQNSFHASTVRSRVGKTISA